LSWWFELCDVGEEKNDDFQWENTGSHVTQREELVSSEGCDLVIVTNIHMSRMFG
jgi:hypothetical protein